MPSSVGSVLTAAGVKRDGVVRWGELINCDEPGIYIVSVTDDPDAVGGDSQDAPIDISSIETLLRVRPELKLDDRRPTSDELATRVKEFWLPDEHIVYIGLATDLHDRVNQYYGTPLGARRPHAGGWFLKTLKDLDKVFVHWSRTYDRVVAEGSAIGTFVANVSEASRTRLRDPERPFPFANLEWPPGTRKRHGISGAKAPRVRAPGTESATRRQAKATSPSAAPAAKVPPSAAPESQVRTSAIGKRGHSQRVTAADVSGGRIRVPKETKRLLPTGKGRITINLRGKIKDVSWDPRTGPPERSGVISVGRQDLAAAVQPDEVLRITVSGDAYVIG